MATWQGVKHTNRKDRWTRRQIGRKTEKDLGVHIKLIVDKLRYKHTDNNSKRKYYGA